MRSHGSAGGGGAVVAIVGAAGAAAACCGVGATIGSARCDGSCNCSCGCGCGCGCGASLEVRWRSCGGGCGREGGARHSNGSRRARGCSGAVCGGCGLGLRREGEPELGLRRHASRWRGGDGGAAVAAAAAEAAAAAAAVRPSSAGHERSPRHMGQRVLMRSHESMHFWWKWCLHGRSLTASPGL